MKYKKTKILNEGLFSMLLDTIFSYATAKKIKNDPEFWNTLKAYDNEIKRLSKEIEDDLSKIKFIPKSQRQPPK